MNGIGPQILSAASLPSAGSSKMTTIRPSLKRELPAATPALAAAIAGPVLASSFAGGSRYIAPFAGALPGRMAEGMSVVNAGYSTTDQQTDEVIAQPLIMRSWHPHPWERSFVEGTSLFVNRKEPWAGTQGLHAVASIPVLNYFSELAAMHRTKQLARPLRPPGAAGRRQVPALVDDEYAAVDPADFAQKWNYIGTAAGDQGAGGVANRSVSVYRAREKMINENPYGRVPGVFCLFSEQPRRGERLYFITREYEASQANFTDPDGSVIAGRAEFPAPFMQTRGMTDQSAGFAAHCTIGADLASGDGPFVGDVDYIRRQHRIAHDWTEFDWSEETGELVVVRQPVEDEGVQAAVDAVPDTVYEAYMEGDVKYVGVARQLIGEGPSAKHLADAHRDHNRMRTLATLELWAGI